MHVHNVPTTFQVMHHLRALVELHQCTNFRVAPSKFPEVKKRCLLPMYVQCAIVHSARAMHMHYATHHQMQCTIELRTLNFISVPNLVLLAQNFLEPEDGITVHMLRSTFPIVGPHLLKIVNHCITKCDLPDQWKAATVTALHKNGDTSDPNNYRPMSVIPVVAKLCERVVCTQLMTYLTAYNVQSV